MGFGAEGLLIDSSIQPLLGHLQNVKNRKFVREMYGRQRNDALEDWYRTNEYNSPRAQMQRFQEAGLNPNLIYGQMTEAGGVRSSSAGGASGTAPDFSIASKALGYANLKQSQAQTDNLLEVNENLRVERDLKKAQIAQIVTNTNLTEVQKQKLLFDLGVATDLRDTTIEGKKWDLELTKLRANEIQGSITRAWQLHPGNLQKQALDILNARLESAQKQAQTSKTRAEISMIEQMIQRVKNDVELQQYDIDLARKHINPKDPGIFRMLQDKLRRLLDNLDK